MIDQVTFMVYLGIQDSLGYHGGGAHQWNVTLSNVQYNYRVSLLRDALCFGRRGFRESLADS